MERGTGVLGCQRCSRRWRLSLCRQRTRLPDRQAGYKYVTKQDVLFPDATHTFKSGEAEQS